MRNEWIQERMNAVKEQGKARARALFEALPEDVDKRQLKAGIEVLFNGLPDQAIADDGLPGPIFWNVREHPYLASDTYGTLMVKAERQRGVFLCRVLAYVDKACLSKRLNQTWLTNMISSWFSWVRTSCGLKWPHLICVSSSSRTRSRRPSWNQAASCSTSFTDT